MLSKNESGTNSGATVSGTYQNQLKKLFTAAKITTLVKSLSQVGNSWVFLILLKSFSILKFAMTQWLLGETRLSKFFCHCYFFSNSFMLFLSWKRLPFLKQFTYQSVNISPQTSFNEPLEFSESIKLVGQQ